MLTASTCRGPLTHRADHDRDDNAAKVRDLIQQLAAERPGILTTAIPALSIIEQMAERRSPITAFAPHSAAAQSYEALWGELNGR
jgi:chromosome partitioning protein